MTEQKYREFVEQNELGAQICTKIRHIYYSKDSGYDSYKKVADKLTMLKKKARLFFADHSELDMLKKLRDFSTDDLKELLEC